MGAPTFKEQIAADISTTFLNCLEFADTHTVNGKEMMQELSAVCAKLRLVGSYYANNVK